MMTLRTLAERRSQILGLAERYRAGEVRVFGSVARGDATEDSDVDLLIKPRRGCSLFDLGGLLEDLQELLGCRVDLVTEWCMTTFASIWTLSGRPSRSMFQR